ncbi:MAG: holo-ACP synthase [Treponema sp.]|nr:holo-ACP synthase [Treponema sp.]
MICGIGIDLVNIRRMEKWVLNENLLNRYFHQEEIRTVLSCGKRAAQSLAARFAAKEAFGKALGTGLSGFMLKDIMVHNNDDGKPEMRVYESAQTALEKSGANRMHISLTHEGDNALAMVILEKV